MNVFVALMLSLALGGPAGDGAPTAAPAAPDEFDAIIAEVDAKLAREQAAADDFDAMFAEVLQRRAAERAVAAERPALHVLEDAQRGAVQVLTALQLMRECRAVFERGEAAAEDMLGSVRCVGYLQGFADAHALLVSVAPSARRWCEPEGGLETRQRVMAVLKHLTNVVLKHLANNPEHLHELHESARTHVLVAHAKAFPCGSTPKGQPVTPR